MTQTPRTLAWSLDDAEPRADGYVSRSCPECGESYPEDYPIAAGHLTRQLVKVLSQRDRFVALLREIEFSCELAGPEGCWWCGSTRKQGHTPDCHLKAALE